MWEEKACQAVTSHIVWSGAAMDKAKSWKSMEGSCETKCCFKSCYDHMKKQAISQKFIKILILAHLLEIDKGSHNKNYQDSEPAPIIGRGGSASHL